MKRFYYCDGNIEIPVELSQKEDLENERRKLLSIETNRRRREMALKVKRQIENEDRRRKEILKQRKEYQNNLNEKLHRRSAQRSGRNSNVHQLTSSDLDQTLSVLRNTVPSFSLKHRAHSSEDVSKYNNRVESAWTGNREACASPMIKYSGPDGINRHRENDHYFKTFETKLMEQEEAFRQRQNIEMSKFSNMLNETIDSSNNAKNTVVESATYRMEGPVRDNDSEDVIECVDDEDYTEDSLEVDTKNDRAKETNIIPGNFSELKKVTIDKNTTKEEKSSDGSEGIIPMSIGNTTRNSELSPPHPVLHINDNYSPYEPNKSTITQNNQSLHSKSATIKSILKKGLSNKFGSNPDLPVSEHSIDIRDSVEITKARTSKLFRSSSFSQGLDESSNGKTNADDDAAKKFVRFADDSRNNAVIAEQHIPKVPQSYDPNKVPLTPKVHKIFTVPGSTPLKPPLHPRSTQEGSYLQGAIKRSPIYQPPPRPKKISADTLDKQLEPFMHPKKAATTNDAVTWSGNAIKQDDVLCDIALDKTPTEKEIEQLWAEVRECLSKSRTTSKPESVGPISGRTVDSGSEVSVMSAPAWQRSAQRAVPFQVRHHRPWSSRQVTYPGQECPIKNEVTVHNPSHVIPTTVTQQPLNVIDQRDQGFQTVSDSMEEFLSLEGACNTPNPRRPNSTTPSAITPVFLPRPPSNIRMRVQPIRPSIFNDSHLPIDRRKSNLDTSNTPRTQLSLDEDKVKKSLDRLNDRLKNMTTFA